MKWYLKVFKQYADFGGRARRKEFWYFVLFNFIAAIVAVIIDAATGWKLTTSSSLGLPNYGPCYLTYILAALLPALAVAVRRLHDVGKSGWWLFIGLIPFVGGIWLLVLYCKEGESEKNGYGANPKSVERYFPGRRREKSIAIAFIVGAAVLLASLALNWIQYNLPFRFWLIPALTSVLMLLFGIFYHPAGDLRKTANRRNIAFVLLAIAPLIGVIQDISRLIRIGNIDVLGLILVEHIIGLLTNLALLALAVLLLLKSERKNIVPVAVSTIVLILVSVVMVLGVKFIHFHLPLFEIVLEIAIILLAVHCLQGKVAEEEESSLISSEPGNSKMTASNKAVENLTPEDFEKPVDKELLERWKKSVAEQKSAAIIVLVLWGAGLLFIILLQGLVGLALLFAFLITAMVISLSKKKKVKESFDRLGITETELKQALDVCSRRIRL